MPLAIVRDARAPARAARLPPRRRRRRRRRPRRRCGRPRCGEIAERVEAERGLRFERAPEVRTVTPARAREEAAASLDEDFPPARREAEAQVLAMLGLLPPGFDLGEAALGTFDSAVAGYYDPRSRALRVIEGAQTGNRVLYETTVAHELTHALEDEVFDFDLDAMAAGGDGALAYSALIEGSATAVMTRYMTRRFGAEETLGATLGSALLGTGTEGLPPFLTAQLIFPYTAGERFVARLLEVGGGGWDVVDAAMRFRPPASTEQVLHPGKYLEVEQPVRVAAPALPGWERRSRSTLGEWTTARMLARAGGTGANEAAAGWGGDALALLRAPGRRPGARRALAVGLAARRAGVPRRPCSPGAPGRSRGAGRSRRPAAPRGRAATGSPSCGRGATPSRWASRPIARRRGH